MRSEQYTEKVDIYSFAMVLWYMIHGERPLHTTSQRDFMAAGCFAKGDRHAFIETFCYPDPE